MSGSADRARSPGPRRHRNSVLVAGETREAGTAVEDSLVQDEDAAATATTRTHTTARFTSPPLPSAWVTGPTRRATSDE